MNARSCAAGILAGMALLAAGGAAAGDRRHGVDGEVGLLVGRHDNFFFRGPGAPAPADNLMTLFVSARRETGVGRGDLTLSASARLVFAQEIPSADYQTARAGAAYRRGPTKVEARYTRRQNMVFDEDPSSPVFYDLDGIEARVRRSLRPGMWLRAEVERERWRFDAVASGRDATETSVSLTFRFAIARRLAMRLVLLHQSKDARSDTFDWSGPGGAVAFEIEPSARTSLFVRYRRRERSYSAAPAGESNFGREDTIHDVAASLRWRVEESWGFLLRDNYRKGVSRRADRNYTANYLASGVFYAF